MFSSSSPRSFNVLCAVSRDIFLSEPSLLDLRAPIKIAGDIHGQYTTLLQLLKHGGLPPESKYLFLGNYVDFGKQSLETIWLLLALKIKYPHNFFLLRGNHECATTNSIYGFRDECVRRFNFNLWNVFNECFECLPIAAIISQKILCVHGGLSPNLHNLDQIRNIERPIDDPYIGLIHELLWSNLATDIQGLVKNVRVFPTFGADKVTEFLKENDLELICRGHQAVEQGYEFYADKKLVTIFSAPNQRARNGRELYNAGALMSVDENLICSFKILQPFDSFDESVNLGLNFGSHASTTTTQSETMMKVVEMSKFNTGSDAGRAEADSRPGINTSKFDFDPGSLYRNKSPGVKSSERMNISKIGTSDVTSKSESSPGVNPSKKGTSASKYRSNSPGFKVAEMSKFNTGSGTSRAEADNRLGINPSKFDFDPASLYRSKSPGVKRFLGARV